MDNNDLKERDFEAYIEHWLLTEGGYTKGNQATYDKERAIDLKTLIRFLQLTQEKKWELYEKKYIGYISAGEKNRFNHPNKDTMLSIIDCGCIPRIVSDDVSTIVINKYVVDI